MKLILLVVLCFINHKSQPTCSTSLDVITQSDKVKQEAFYVLDTKCNFCHNKSKNRVDFTLSNMNRFAKAIDYQVFQKKKMPKGRKNQLTQLEEDKLNAWISTFEKS